MQGLSDSPAFFAATVLAIWAATVAGAGAVAAGAEELAEFWRQAVDTLNRGEGPHPLREAYETDVKNLQNQLDSMRSEGKDWEEIARTLSGERRDLGEKHKDMTAPDLREQIYQRNIRDYGDPLGPTIQWFRDKGYSWQEIAEKSCRPGGKDLGF